METLLEFFVFLEEVIEFEVSLSDLGFKLGGLEAFGFESIRMVSFETLQLIIECFLE